VLIVAGVIGVNVMHAVFAGFKTCPTGHFGETTGGKGIMTQTLFVKTSVLLQTLAGGAIQAVLAGFKICGGTHVT
jgi:hypothetical protein